MSRNTVIIIIVAVVILLGGGGFYLASRNTQKGPTPTPTPDSQQVLTLQPSDIGLILAGIDTGKFAGHGISINILKIADIASIDYQLSYTAKGNIPRGAIGHVDIKPSDTKFMQQLPFGTCSDVCHFDSDVSDVKVTMKITKNDGKIYSVEQAFNQ